MKVAFLNPQGNFDPEDRYWTEHPDFGGQLVYVKEVAQALAKKGVEVDIITRRIIDPDWPGFEKEIDFYPGILNLRIVRIPFGGDRFLRKEDLWSFIPDFVNGICDFYKKDDSRVDFFTAHYADGGLSGALLHQQMGIPFSFTGHSLGAQKMDKLGFSEENSWELENKYHFTNRIWAERISMKYSAVNIVSTLQERYQQYSHQLYRGAIQVEDDRRFSVIPPGVNTRIFFPVKNYEELREIEKKVIQSKTSYLFQDRWELPWIVASSRLEPKKNHLGLFKAFAQNADLQARGNLCVILRGIQDPLNDYREIPGTEGVVLTQLAKIIRQYNLEGKVCFLDLRSQGEIAACYRYLSMVKSIFVLTALYEPFGLAPLEAAACGLPVVVTQNGGPSESLREEAQEYGVLVDPESTESIAQGILRLLKDTSEWAKFARTGMERVKSRYTWERTATGYLENIMKIFANGSKRSSKICSTPMVLKDLIRLYVQGGGI